MRVRPPQATLRGSPARHISDRHSELSRHPRGRSSTPHRLHRATHAQIDRAIGRRQWRRPCIRISSPPSVSAATPEPRRDVASAMNVRTVFPSQTGSHGPTAAVGYGVIQHSLPFGVRKRRVGSSFFLEPAQLLALHHRMCATSAGAASPSSARSSARSKSPDN